MLETAACADHDGGESEVGRGDTRRWIALYLSAEVDGAVLSQRLHPCDRRNLGADVVGRARAFAVSAAIDFREAIV